MNKKPKKVNAATAKAKAEQQARKKEAAAFFKQDYPKILKAQRMFEYPCDKREQTVYEVTAFRNFLTCMHDVNQADLLSILEDVLYNKYPEAHAAWHKALKAYAVEQGYCKWAKKHPDAAAELF